MKVVAFTAVLAFGGWLVLFFGMIFEFEYPYTFTLMSVQHAKSVNGVQVSRIIKGDGAKWSPTAYGNGYGDFELPENWFRKVTHTGGAANRSQPASSGMNRTSAGAGAGG